MNISTLLRRCDRAGLAANTPKRKRGPQYHIWVNGDILPHSTREEQERNYYPAHVERETGRQLDPNRDYVVHWCREERLAEFGL